MGEFSCTIINKSNCYGADKGQIESCFIVQDFVAKVEDTKKGGKRDR
jgi:hypothetical protein